MIRVVFILFLGLYLGANESYYDKGVLVELSSSDKARALGSSNSYETPSGVIVSVTNELLVKCKEDVGCLELLSSYKPQEVKQISKTLYMLKVENTQRVFSLSRELYESGSVEFAHPNFRKKSTKR